MNNKKAKALRRAASASATNGADFQCLTAKRIVRGAADAEGLPVKMTMPVSSSWQEGTARRLYQDSKSAA